MNATIKQEFVTVLGCNEKAIQVRLIALGHSTVCGRCGGVGHYSFNLMHGTVCFGCNGAGKITTKLTPKLLEIVSKEIAEGKLQPYLDNLKAAQARRAKIKGRMDKLFAAWKSCPTVAEFANVHFLNQSARCNSINHFCSPLIDEAGKLIQLVEKGEWSKELRRYVPVSDEQQNATVSRIMEIQEQMNNAETLAPDIEWSKEKNRFVEVVTV